MPGFPIVLHGASSVIPEYVEMINQYGGDLAGAKGVPEEMLRKAASMAVCKINIDSDLRLAFTATIRKYLAETPAISTRQYWPGPDRHQGDGEAQDYQCPGLRRQGLKAAEAAKRRIPIRLFLFYGAWHVNFVNLIEYSEIYYQDRQLFNFFNFE